MAKIYTSAAGLIGRTPLLELTNLEKKYGLKARILAKLEYLNPAGSVKDRIALAMGAAPPPAGEGRRRRPGADPRRAGHQGRHRQSR